MDKELALRLSEIVEGAEFIEDYEGRNGEKTSGVNVEDELIVIESLINNAHEMCDNLDDGPFRSFDIFEIKRDNFGKGIILY